MDETRFFEIRKQLYSLLEEFNKKCESLDIDFMEEIDVMISEIESS